jgi:hypothetical protein
MFKEVRVRKSFLSKGWVVVAEGCLLYLSKDKNDFIKYHPRYIQNFLFKSKREAIGKLKELFKCSRYQDTIINARMFYNVEKK